MTINELAKMVADDFTLTMKDNDFDTFVEMKECYDWNSRDIRTEVEYTIRASESGWDMMDDSDIYHFDENGRSYEFETYRRFINDVYNILKAEGIYA